MRKDKTVLEKLHEIEGRKVIYAILYRNVGIGFQYYNVGEDTRDGLENWQQHISVQKFYPTFEQAVEGEYKRFRETEWE